MEIRTKKQERVEYRATPADGLEFEAVVVGSSLADGRVTFTYADVDGRGSLTVGQAQISTILEFIAKLQYAEAVRLGLIPAPDPVPPAEEPTGPTEPVPTDPVAPVPVEPVPVEPDPVVPTDPVAPTEPVEPEPEPVPVEPVPTDPVVPTVNPRAKRRSE